MEKIRKPPSFNPFDAGSNKLRPSAAHGRTAPFSKLKVLPNPGETTSSTEHRGPSVAELTPAEEAKLDKPLPADARNVPSKAAKGDDDLMSLPPQRS